MPIYLPGDTPVGGAYPAILAIGDSWFWYPKNNILQALAEHPALKDPYRNIQVLGYNGAAISQYVDRNNVQGRYARELQYQLSPNQSAGYSAVLISGGGNDAVDYRLALPRDCTGKGSLDQCIDQDGLKQLVDGITGALNIILFEIATSFASRPRPVDVFIHGYDYPCRMGAASPWPGCASWGRG